MPPNFFFWDTAGGPFHLCDSHSTECCQAGDPGISESRELVQSPALPSPPLPPPSRLEQHVLCEASANDDKKESSREKQLSFNASKIVRNVKYI